MTIAPAVVIRYGIAIWRAWQERRARRRLTHRDDIEAIGRLEDRTVGVLSPPSGVNQNVEARTIRKHFPPLPTSGSSTSSEAEKQEALPDRPTENE